MTANSLRINGLRELQKRVHASDSAQPIDTTRVAPDTLGQSPRKGRDFVRARFANSLPGNDILPEAARPKNSGLRNTIATNHLPGFRGASIGEKAQKRWGKIIAASTLTRWCKFNLVGGIGIAIQFTALFFLKSVLHFHYLAATALAVEIAVLHNFIWHERFTWAHRVVSDHTRSIRAQRWRRSVTRLLRFHLANGVVSILGNLALMKVMVGQGHVNYLIANAIAIALCSVANFLVSDGWVFQNRRPGARGPDLGGSG